MKKALPVLINLILAYLTTVSIAFVSGYGITGIEIMLPCVFALTFTVYVASYKKIAGNTVGDKNCKRDIRIALPLAFVFALSVVVGAHTDVWNQVMTGVGIKDIVYLVFLTLFFGACLILLFGAIDKIKNNGSGDNKEGEKRLPFLVLFLIMVLCYLPYYLTMLPGNLGKDTFESIDMCLGNIPWTNHHPIFFTALINVVIKLTAAFDSITVSMAVFTFIHMVLVALTLTYLVSWLYRRSKSRLWIVAYVFFALHPIAAMFSIYISKDVFFGLAVVMLTLKLSDILKYGEKSNKDYLLLGVWALLTMLLRNNGILMVAGLALVLLLVFKLSDKRMLVAVLASLILFFLFKTCAVKALNISPESFAESASVPLQQVGYVIAESEGRSFDEKEGEAHKITGISDEEIAFLERLMPAKKVSEVYELGYTDSYKFDEAFDDEFFNENKGEFMKIWWHLLPGHFPEYVKAYLAQTAGYWHYGETNTVCTQGIWEDNAVGVNRVDVIKNITGISLYGIIEKLMLGMRKAPLLCILSSMAMQFYALLLLIAEYIRKRNGKGAIIVTPLILLWVSIMIATPAFCLFRYTYPLFLLWPYFIFELMGLNSEGNK